MKIFISWSGKRSLGVATALREWLPFLFPNIELFVSSEDIRKGKRWPLEVSKELDTSNFGIVCMTHDNLEAPWLVFEAGALSKSVKEASVFTLLTGGLRSSDVEGPLSHFQHTIFDREDFFKLIKTINDAQGQGKQEDARLNKIFDKFWDELEANVAKAIKASDTKPEKTRSPEDMLRELLELTSHIARNMPVPREHQDTISITKPEPERLWGHILELIGKTSPFTKTYLEGADGAGYADGTFTVTFPEENKEYIAMIRNEKTVKLLKTILTQIGYSSNIKIDFAVSGQPSAKTA